MTNKMVQGCVCEGAGGRYVGVCSCEKKSAIILVIVLSCTVSNLNMSYGQVYKALALLWLAIASY